MLTIPSHYKLACPSVLFDSYTIGTRPFLWLAVSILVTVQWTKASDLNTMVGIYKNVPGSKTSMHNL